jgi:hypothetical protein
MYRIEWIWPVAAIGILPLLLAPPVAMLAVVVVLIVAVATLVALVGAIVATPFLLFRAARRHGRSGRALPAGIALRLGHRGRSRVVSHPATLSGLR